MTATVPVNRGTEPRTTRPSPIDDASMERKTLLAQRREKDVAFGMLDRYARDPNWFEPGQRHLCRQAKAIPPNARVSARSEFHSSR